MVMEIEIFFSLKQNANIQQYFNLPNPNRKLQKIVDILGRETNPQPNNIIIEIYDDPVISEYKSTYL